MALSDEDLLEMDCLASVARIGELPDGCGAPRYLGLEYIELRDGILALTAKGQERWAELQAREHRGAGIGNPPSSPASLRVTALP